jgi:hypothetical protein
MGEIYGYWETGESRTPPETMLCLIRTKADIIHEPLFEKCSNHNTSPMFSSKARLA